MRFAISIYGITPRFIRPGAGQCRSRGAAAYELFTLRCLRRLFCRKCACPRLYRRSLAALACFISACVFRAIHAP
jgi:hypothetical protein